MEEWKMFFSFKSYSGSGEIDFYVNEKDPNRAVRSASGGESFIRADVLYMAKTIEDLQHQLSATKQSLAAIQVLSDEALKK